MIFEIIAAVVIPPIIYFIYTYLNHILDLKNYPKGPFPLPVIGNLNLLSKKAYRDFAKLSEVHGDVYGFSFGMNRYVIVNTYEAAREVLIKYGPSFSGRPTQYATYELFSRGYQDMAFSEGKLWSLQRKLMHSGLKVYGEHLELIQQLIKKEGGYLLKSFRDKNGDAVDPLQEIGCAVLNVICEITFGRRYEKDDEEFLAIQRSQRLTFEGLKSTDIAVFLPWMKYFTSSGYKLLLEGIALRDPILHKHMIEHLKTFDSKNIRDFTDSLISLSKDIDLQKFGISKLSMDHMEMLVHDIFIGGNETLTTTILWFLVYMIRWPHFQDEIYNELIDVFDGDKYPAYDDRDKTPFTYACVLETLRLSAITAINLPRKSRNDCLIQGQKIPINTTIMINFWNIHTDKRFWKDGEDFVPYRWLDEMGKVCKRESYFPFSAGVRGCPGEKLGMIELYEFIANLMKHFCIEKPENEPLPDLDGSFGITRTPFPFKVCFVERNSSVKNDL